MTSEIAHSMFLPDVADSTLLGRPLLRVTMLQELLGEELAGTMLVLTDSQGCYLVPHSELLEILEAVSLFYELYSDEQIARFNRHRESSVPRRLSRGPPQAKDLSGYVYFLQAGPHYKIGRSKNVEKRLTQLRTLPPFDIELIHTIKTDDMYGLEAHFHDIYDDVRVNGEWFELDEADVIWIRSLS